MEQMKPNSEHVSLEPGSSCQNDNLGFANDLGKWKPSEKAAGLQNDVGSSYKQQAGPVQLSDNAVGAVKVGHESLRPADVNNSSPNIYGLHSDPVLIENKSPKCGSGYFDVTKQNFGLGPKQGVTTKNSFGVLRDEENCYDTELGLWDNEIEVVKNFVESNTRPKLEDYDTWSANMKKYYDGLTKMNEDDEVASETDEMARFMKSGVKA
ncbi:hypothetical protein Hdeb2414_s0012g00376281 [Helianthus debilis subsp. tardiflorus]